MRKQHKNFKKKTTKNKMETNFGISIYGNIDYIFCFNLLKFR